MDFSGTCISNRKIDRGIVMIYFSIADGVILFVILSILTLIISNIMKHRKEGVCSSCSVYKSTKRKASGIKAYYKKVKD
jgi:hypothetical protein